MRVFVIHSLLLLARDAVPDASWLEGHPGLKQGADTSATLSQLWVSKESFNPAPCPPKEYPGAPAALFPPIVCGTTREAKITHNPLNLARQINPGASAASFLPIVCDTTREAEVVAVPRIVSKRWPGAGVDLLVHVLQVTARPLFARSSVKGGVAARRV